MSHSTLVDPSDTQARAPTAPPVRPGETNLVVCALAEGIGTFALVFAGCGAIMIATYSATAKLPMLAWASSLVSSSP